MIKHLSIVFAAAALSTVAFGQIANPGIFIDAYQINYAANLNSGDSSIILTNTGVQGPFIGGLPATVGNICVNVYTFDPAEEEIACCACLVTPNGLNSLSAQADLISNPLTPAIPSSIVIKLVASQPGQAPTGAFNVCNAATLIPTPATIPYTPSTPVAVTTGDIAAGMRAWVNTLEGGATPGSFGVVHGSFLPSVLEAPELNALTSTCNFIQGDGSGFGICKSCRTGALGGAKK